MWHAVSLSADSLAGASMEDIRKRLRIPCSGACGGRFQVKSDNLFCTNCMRSFKSNTRKMERGIVTKHTSRSLIRELPVAPPVVDITIDFGSFAQVPVFRVGMGSALPDTTFPVAARYNSHCTLYVRVIYAAMTPPRFFIGDGRGTQNNRTLIVQMGASQFGTILDSVRYTGDIIVEGPISGNIFIIW